VFYPNGTKNKNIKQKGRDEISSYPRPKTRGGGAPQRGRGATKSGRTNQGWGRISIEEGGGAAVVFWADFFSGFSQPREQRLGGNKKKTPFGKDARRLRGRASNEGFKRGRDGSRKETGDNRGKGGEVCPFEFCPLHLEGNGLAFWGGAGTQPQTRKGEPAV